MSWLVANTVVAAALALLTLAIGRWGRPAPAVMHVLWLFVLLKLVTPPLVSFEIDLGAVAPPAPRVVPLDAVLDAVLAGAAPAAKPVAAVEPAASSFDWATVAWLVFAGGSAALFARLFFGLRRIRRHLRSLAPAPTALVREVGELARQLGVRAPRVCDDPTASSPFVVGLVRPWLVVGAARLRAASAKGRAAVLVHELAHLRRADHWLAHFEVLLGVVLWWHPLFWFARRELRHHAELAADAWAVACVPDATIDYAAVLVQAVAAPDSAVSAPTVLAARPVTGSAFETRLNMILNENVPCRASRAWWLPLTSLACGLLATPVLAQSKSQDPAPIEIRVNGKEVGELSGAERAALLKKLLAAEEQDEAKKSAKKPKSKSKTKPKVEDDSDGEAMGTFDVKLEGLGELGDLGKLMREGLAEAKLEILADEDLKNLGITDEVVGMLDDLGAGKGIDRSLDAIVKAALQGAMPMVEKELRADDDLKELGLTDGVVKLVREFLGNERNQEMLGGMARQMADRALREAKVEILADDDLKELGIEVEVGGLVDKLLHGGDANGDLQKIVVKAMRAAEGAKAGVPEAEVFDVELAPKKAKAKKAKNAKKARSEREEIR